MSYPDQSPLPDAAATLAHLIHNRQNPEPETMDVTLSVDQLLPAVNLLQEAWWGYLAAITGLDEGAAADQITILYHFVNGPAILTLRVSVPYSQPVVPSLCAIIPSASFYEREIHEMFGVTVTDTPNTDYLFLPDEWPKGNYPMRKDYQPAAMASHQR